MKHLKDLFKKKKVRANKAAKAAQPKNCPIEQKSGVNGAGSTTIAPNLPVVAADPQAVSVQAADVATSKSSNCVAPETSTHQQPSTSPPDENPSPRMRKRPIYARGASFVPMCCPHPDVSNRARSESASKTCPLQACLPKSTKSPEARTTSNLEPFATPIQTSPSTVRFSTPPTTAELLLNNDCSNMQLLVARVKEELDQCLSSIQVSKEEYEIHQKNLDKIEVE